MNVLAITKSVFTSRSADQHICRNKKYFISIQFIINIILFFFTQSRREDVEYCVYVCEKNRLTYCHTHESAEIRLQLLDKRLTRPEEAN